MKTTVERIMCEATLRERNERLHKINVLLALALLVACIWIGALAL